MPARSTHKAHTTRHTAPPSPEPIAISPTLVALVQFACNQAPIANGFLVAWQQMPALVAQLVDGEGDSCEGTTRYSVIRTMIDAAIVQSRTATNGHDRRLGRAIDAIETVDDDAFTEVEVAISDPAFYTGLAMGLYLMTNPAPVAVSPDGAR